jgi:hypothetical protein
LSTLASSLSPVPKLLFAFPSSGHGGIRHLAIITWRRILQLFYSDAAVISHTTPDQDQITKVALARFADLSLALSHRILILNRTITITADHPLLLDANSKISPLACISAGGRHVSFSASTTAALTLHGLQRYRQPPLPPSPPSVTHQVLSALFTCRVAARSPSTPELEVGRLSQAPL